MTDAELLYSATARCRCGAGLAYPLDHQQAMALGAWICSFAAKDPSASPNEHDSYPFAFYNVREETSINNATKQTTRPPGTVALTLGMAKCPKCDHEWESEPYSACGLGHHWFSGPCLNCGHAVGGAGVWSSSDGPRIETRFRTVVRSQ